MLTENDFIYKGNSGTVEKLSFEWSSPSNIALVKYWGKKENQLPANPSISFTLNNCKTVTKVDIERRFDGNFTFDLLFEGKPKPEFNQKINQFFTHRKVLFVHK